MNENKTHFKWFVYKRTKSNEVITFQLSIWCMPRIILLSIAKNLVMDFPCTKCHQVLKGKNSLKKHTKRFHPNTDKELIKCSECEKNRSDILFKKTYF